MTFSTAMLSFTLHQDFASLTRPGSTYLWGKQPERNQHRGKKRQTKSDVTVDGSLRVLIYSLSLTYSDYSYLDKEPWKGSFRIAALDYFEGDAD